MSPCPPVSSVACSLWPELAPAAPPSRRRPTPVAEVAGLPPAPPGGSSPPGGVIMSDDTGLCEQGPGVGRDRLCKGDERREPVGPERTWRCCILAKGERGTEPALPGAGATGASIRPTGVSICLPAQSSFPGFPPRGRHVEEQNPESSEKGVSFPVCARAHAHACIRARL